MSHQAASRRVTADVDAVDDSGCSILHVDMDAFFAAVELLRHPELRGRPMMVAGLGGRGVVLSATYEARAHGVRSALPTATALALCPGIAVVPPDHHAYRAASAELMALLRSYTPLVEPVSVDEAFLDVSGSLRRLGRPARIAERVRTEVRDELGLTATVGVASTKFVAKLASSLAKPDGLLVVPRADVSTFLRPLPVGALWGVGPRTAATLQSNGFATVGELADAPVSRLFSVVGQASARSLHALSHGRDSRAVTPESTEVSIGAEQTFEQDVVAAESVHRALLALAATVGRRLRRAGRAGRTVVVKVRFSDFTTVTRSETLPAAVDDDRSIYESALGNWRRLASGSRPVRLLGVRLENLADARDVEEQLALDLEPDGLPDDRDSHPIVGRRQGVDRAAQQAVYRTVDALAARFGSAAPQPATLVRRPKPRGAVVSERDEDF